ncbi:MAG: hypothetical protein JXA23_12200 [Bacteroidales bacterium]|nr:hypothetical protein [Bacteroidales bacterium]
MDLLTELSLKKRVIHLGFADHIGLIESKLAKNQWLHKRLMDVTDQCIGIDLNEEAVNFVKEKIGIDKVYTYNLTESPPFSEITNHAWDLMILGEIIEHIDNPVLFLKILKEKYGSCVRSLVITAPNAFRFKNSKAFLTKEEYINSDHRYWFTPYTLAKIGIRAGWTPLRYEYADGTNYPLRLLFKFFPVMCDTLVMVFTSGIDDL